MKSANVFRNENENKMSTVLKIRVQNGKKNDILGQEHDISL